MYKVKIVNHETWEILECYDVDLSQARRLANVAYFSAGYDDEKMEISIINDITGEVVTNW